MCTSSALAVVFTVVVVLAMAHDRQACDDVPIIRKLSACVLAEVRLFVSRHAFVFCFICVHGDESFLAAHRTLYDPKSAGRTVRWRCNTSSCACVTDHSDSSVLGAKNEPWCPTRAK